MKKSLYILSTVSFFLVFSLVATSSCTKAKAPVSTGPLTCSDTISFNQQIAPMIQTYCSSCHGSGAGTTPVLSNHAEISSAATDILGTLHGTPQLMPQGGPALADSLIQQFECWTQQGKMNN
ncbi:hypothetical protein [Fluviicola sp.]|jgi:cytochrome c553|uniref:hypothetical protein n=1 Tax=Fluviicola sp. TaxID=1917219 RepID=UPI0028186AF7|nr:hypothetical protein [Fluviicola sp.]MDR0803418.1 hypothetical protein [Fluviicola sp.]